MGSAFSYTNRAMRNTISRNAAAADKALENKAAAKEASKITIVAVN